MPLEMTIFYEGLERVSQIPGLKLHEDIPVRSEKNMLNAAAVC
jgi:hypothetical protein